jgi:hypothetical protein
VVEDMREWKLIEQGHIVILLKIAPAVLGILILFNNHFKLVKQNRIDDETNNGTQCCYVV